MFFFSCPTLNMRVMFLINFTISLLNPLFPIFNFESERRVSNPQPPAWKAGALPIELLSLGILFNNATSIVTVGTGGFEPPKSKQQIYSLSHLATLVYPHFKNKSRRRDSNPRPTDYKSVALPAELLRLIFT